MKNSKYFLGTLVIMLALLLGGCNYKSLLNKAQTGKNNSQNRTGEVENNIKSFEFELTRALNKGEQDLFVKQIKKRLAAYGYADAQVEWSGDNKFKISFAVPANIIFIENDFVNYLSNTPTFEIRLKEDPKNVVLTEQEKKSIESYNKDALARAQQILAQVLKEPDKFAELAKKFSEDPGSKNNGGLYKGVKRGQFVKEYEEVVFDKLKDGEIYPQVVETVYGYHIIKRESHQGEGKDMQVDTRHILIMKKREQDILAAKQWKETGISGLEIDKAAAAVTQDKKQYALVIQLNQAGTAKLKELSSNNKGKQIAIFIDGVGVATPTLDKPIEDGRIILSGIFNQQGVANLASRLNSGAIYTPVRLVKEIK